MEKLDILELGNKFRSNLFKNEDDIKLNTYSDIILPIQKRFAPDARFLSEYTFAKGGRADGTIGNLVFEYKRFEYFNKESGINEALYGRSSNKNDSGLYQYIISSIEGDIIDDSILDTFGIGFDGQTWIIARFAKSLETNSLDLTRTRFKDLYNQNQINCQYVFQYKKFNLYEGIEQLITLFTSTNKTKITKDNLNAVLILKMRWLLMQCALFILLLKKSFRLITLNVLLHYLMNGISHSELCLGMKMRKQNLMKLQL